MDATPLQLRQLLQNDNQSQWSDYYVSGSRRYKASWRCQCSRNRSQCQPYEEKLHATFWCYAMWRRGHCWVVGFTSVQIKWLANCQDTMDPVDLIKIKVEKAKHSGKVEIWLKSSSEVQSSPKKCSLSKVRDVLPNISLDQLDKQNECVCVTVITKVIRLEDLMTVMLSLRKQNVTITNSSAAAKLTLWENSISKLLMNKSYCSSNFTVHTYRSEKWLSEGATIEEAPDISNGAEDDLPDDSIVISRTTVAAAALSVYHTCLACTSELEPMDGTLCML